VNKKGIVLIGMPGSGKTVLGKEAAHLLGLEFIDADEFLTIKEGRSIVTIFTDGGEAEFRRIETEVLQEISGNIALGNTEKGVLLSVGGGAITQAENLPLLRQIGRVVYIKRNLDAIAAGITFGAERPLLIDEKKLHALYEERKELYEAWADDIFEVDEGKSIAENAAGLAAILE